MEKQIRIKRIDRIGILFMFFLVPPGSDLA